MLDVLCHFEVCVVLGALVDEVAMGRIALACHFSLDLLRDKTSSLPVVNDHVSVRNWPPSPYLHVATESANVISLAAAHEPALMQYVLDGPTWSFICPFVDLLDFFNMRTAATSRRQRYTNFSCCTMHLGIWFTTMCKCTVHVRGR